MAAISIEQSGIQPPKDWKKLPKAQRIALMQRLEEMKSEAYCQLFQQYRADPVGYARDILHQHLTAEQEAICLSVLNNRRTAVKASHAIGKTHIAAILACWWYDCWDEHIVYITAPSWKQALGLTFKQIKKFRREFELPGEILETGMVRDINPSRTPAHFIQALNAESGEGFQGEHSAPILIIMEEAVGVPRYVFEASDGLMTHPDCRMLLVANPTDESTDFGQACRSTLYSTLTIRALEHPNVLAELKREQPPFPKAVRLAWVMEMLEKECQRAERPEGDAFEFPPGSGVWHVPNAVFQGRVLGEFPTQISEQVIPRSWLTNMPRHDAAGLPEVGVDIAWHGDDRTVIAIRRGCCLLRLVELRRLDPDYVREAIKDEVKRIAEVCNCNEKEIPIRIDTTGGLGAGPYTDLTREDYNAYPVNSAGAASDTSAFRNLRSELWFSTSELARKKEMDFSRLPNDLRERLINELSAPKYRIEKGFKVVEGKKEVKKRLKQSPDLADAVNLSFYHAVKAAGSDSMQPDDDWYSADRNIIPW